MTWKESIIIGLVFGSCCAVVSYFFHATTAQMALFGVSGFTGCQLGTVSYRYFWPGKKS